MEKEKKQIVIAMSGGVDSSVAAALLVEQGYSVTGMMLKLWSDDCGEADNACCPPEAIDQARQVANILRIPFYVLDVQQIFKQQVVDPFIQSYKTGFTPNPCYLCNKNIRWGEFLNRVINSGIEYFATGHYAQVTFEEGMYHLKKGVDEAKDQSYVLSGLNQAQLAHTVFPLGNMYKTDVRKLAQKFNLPTAEKPDSQDLCFVGNGNYRDFLLRHSPESFQKGNIRSVEGKVIGEHNGLIKYTIGQRKGLGAGNAEPLYVIEKDIRDNELIVGSLAQMGKNEFLVSTINWIQGNIPDMPLECEVKIRYKAKPVRAKLTSNDQNTLRVDVSSTLRDITPGQIAVFYKTDEVIGSGIIQSAGKLEGEK